MIVDPDFVDHWRTRMLVDALRGDEFAPLYLLRLWGHCQTRKSTRFQMPARGLKGLCRATTEDPDAFEAALVECGYVARDGECIEVLKWADFNAKLLAAWDNGGKGGRPTKGARDESDETQEEPNKNPNGTQRKPKANPTETHGKPIREDKSRGDLFTSPDGDVGAQPPAAPPEEPDEPTPCPHEAIIAAFHECLPMARRIRDWTPARATALRARWREDRKRQSVAWWQRFFAYCAKSKFLTGQVSTPGRKPFELSLEWLIKAENFAKVREGAYHEPAAEDDAT